MVFGNWLPWLDGRTALAETEWMYVAEPEFCMWQRENSAKTQENFYAAKTQEEGGLRPPSPKGGGGLRPPPPFGVPNASPGSRLGGSGGRSSPQNCYEQSWFSSKVLFLKKLVALASMDVF